MSMDSDSSSHSGADYRSFRQITRDRKSGSHSQLATNPWLVGMRWSLSLRLCLDWGRGRRLVLIPGKCWYDVGIFFMCLLGQLVDNGQYFFLLLLGLGLIEAYLVWKTAEELNWCCGRHSTSVLNCCSSTEFVCIFHAQDWAHIYDFIFHFMHALHDWKYFHSLYCNQALQLIWWASCIKNTIASIIVGKLL
jgi:hypothetical protein